MNAATVRAIGVSTLLLTAIYLWLLHLALTGYGYAGNGGFHNRASRWYFNSAETYHERSNRSGSTGGVQVMGGGPESGK